MVAPVEAADCGVANTTVVGGTSSITVSGRTVVVVAVVAVVAVVVVVVRGAGAVGGVESADAALPGESRD